MSSYLVNHENASKNILEELIADLRVIADDYSTYGNPEQAGAIEEVIEYIQIKYLKGSKNEN